MHPECKTVLGYTVSWQVRLLSLLWMSPICMEDHHTKALLYVSSLQKEAFGNILYLFMYLLCVDPCAHMHVMARGQHLVPSSIPFHLILRQGHSLNLEPTDWLEWLPSKLL